MSGRWDAFVEGLVYGAGPRRAAEILAADPGLSGRIEPSEGALRIAEHTGNDDYLMSESDLRAKAGGSSSRGDIPAGSLAPTPSVDTHPVFAGRSANTSRDQTRNGAPTGSEASAEANSARGLPVTRSS